MLVSAREQFLDEVMGVVRLSPPAVRLVVDPFITLAGRRHNDIQEQLGVIVRLFRADHAPHCRQDHQLVLEREGGPLLNHALKCVGHDCNEHVQECDPRNDDSYDEKCVAQCWTRMLLKAGRVILSNHEVELIES